MGFLSNLVSKVKARRAKRETRRETRRAKVKSVVSSFKPGGTTPSQAIKGEKGDSSATFTSNVQKSIQRLPGGVSDEQLAKSTKALEGKSTIDIIKQGAKGSTGDLITLASGGAFGTLAGLGGVIKGFAAGAGGAQSFVAASSKVSNLGNVGKTVLRTTTDPKTGKILNQVNVNTKTAKQVGSFVSTFFSLKAAAFYSGWLASVGMGFWAQAEAPEGVTFQITKFLIPEAQRTGDWSAVNEALEIAEEVSNLDTWEQIVRFSPAGLLPGALNKLQGNAAAVKIQAKYARDQQVKQENGETEAQYWEQRQVEEDLQQRAGIDYYNEQRRLMIQWEIDAKRNQRNEDAKFWAKERAKQRKKEEEDRQAIADFWNQYRKLAQQINDDSRPSNLNFGLI